MDAALENMKQSLNLLEEKFLQNKQFILGDKISVADGCSGDHAGTTASVITSICVS